MAAPNVVNVATITAKSAVQAVGTAATAIVSNAASSGKVLKLNTLLISNVDGSVSADITVDISKDGTVRHIIKSAPVPVGSTLSVLPSAIYLEENDSVRLTASAASDLEAIVSYEEIS